MFSCGLSNLVYFLLYQQQLITATRCISTLVQYIQALGVSRNTRDLTTTIIFIQLSQKGNLSYYLEAVSIVRTLKPCLILTKVSLNREFWTVSSYNTNIIWEPFSLYTFLIRGLARYYQLSKFLDLRLSQRAISCINYLI